MTDSDIPDVEKTDLTREEMEEVAGEYGIDPDGLDDQQLLERLGVALGGLRDSEGHEQPSEQTVPGEPVDGLTRDEIRDELRELGLPVTGTKDELQARLDGARAEQDGEDGEDGGDAGADEEDADDGRLRDRAADGLKAAADWLQESGRDGGGSSTPSKLKLAGAAVKRRIPFVGR